METIVIKPRWQDVTHAIESGLLSGTFNGMKQAEIELQRMAQAADQAVLFKDAFQTLVQGHAKANAHLQIAVALTSGSDLPAALENAFTEAAKALMESSDTVFKAVVIKDESELPATKQRAALEKALSFIEGFEGDEMQEGIDSLLSEIRGALE